jgi:hypothetical protein
MLDFKKKLLDIVGENASIKHIQKTLKQVPYCMTFKYNETHGLLKYNRGKSDLDNSFVKECRGVIFRLDDYKIVNHTLNGGLEETEFKKNYCIDECVVYESIDGTLLNVYYDNNKWNVSTKGCIDAEKSSWYSNKSFLELMNECSTTIDYSKLDEDCCYSVVLTHIDNRIVVEHNENKLYHVYTRNLKTDKYVEQDIGIVKPLKLEIDSYQSILNSENLDSEGVMIYNADMTDRCKIQTTIYKTVKELRGNQSTAWGRILSLPKQKINDYLDYYPEDKDDYISLCRVKNKLFSSILHYYIQTKVKRIYTEIPQYLKSPVYELHNIYKQALTEYNKAGTTKKPYISKKQIIELFHDLPIYKQLYLLQSESTGS